MPSFATKTEQRTDFSHKDVSGRACFPLVNCNKLKKCLRACRRRKKNRGKKRKEKLKMLKRIFQNVLSFSPSFSTAYSERYGLAKQPLLLPGSNTSIRSLCVHRWCRTLDPLWTLTWRQPQRSRKKQKNTCWQHGWGTTVLPNLSSVLVFHGDFWKCHLPLELSFCCAAVLGYFHQRYSSMAAIPYCALTPPATINISTFHWRLSFCPFTLSLPFFF